jgi:hypothetical protein
MVKLSEFANASGACFEYLSRKDSWRRMKYWRRIYCAPVYEVHGRWSIENGPSWHTFASGFVPCVKGDLARELYFSQPKVELLAIPEGSPQVAIRFTSEQPIDFSGLYLDLYVGPQSFEWTMVFTHEHPHYGPYFSQANWARP